MVLNYVFPIFSGGIEMKHRAKLGKFSINSIKFTESSKSGSKQALEVISENV